MRILVPCLGAGILAVWTIALWPGAASANGLTALSGEMNRINAKLCHTFKASACKTRKPHAAAAPQRKAKRVKRAVKSPAKPDMPDLKPAVAKPLDKPVIDKAVIPVPLDKPVIDKAVIPVPLAKPKPHDVPPPPAVTETPAVPVTPPPAVVAPDADCLASLAAVKAEYALAPTPVSTQGCRVDGAVNLKAVQTAHGRVEFPEGPLLTCRFAAQFAHWVSEQGAVLTAAHAGEPLAKVWTGPGYQCRGRNGDGSAKLSEHGFGDAVDIERFATASGRQLIVGDALNSASSSSAALQAMRHSACGYFTTVLGPGANAAHASHFHFDLGQHGKSGTYRICE